MDNITQMICLGALAFLIILSSPLLLLAAIAAVPFYLLGKTVDHFFGDWF